MTTATETETRVRLKLPSLYKVVLLNDNFTPMEFVIQVLVELFNKTPSEAHGLCMQVHDKGRGVAGIFTQEIAEQKVKDTLTVAHHYGHPLKAVTEEA
jgi:ATP-dependent Clp protease adaptor protein ClpS